MADAPTPSPNPWSDVWFLVIGMGVLLLLGVVSGTISKQTARTLFIAPPYQQHSDSALDQLIEESGYASSTATTTHQ
ncbi:MAG: hypothetical protein JWO43_286 [Candidatus Adlerbacteria bacterium]|nr:hypothetical protein [Candidatus Adlerbacteria bacterium]